MMVGRFVCVAILFFGNDNENHPSRGKQAYGFNNLRVLMLTRKPRSRHLTINGRLLSRVGGLQAGTNWTYSSMDATHESPYERCPKQGCVADNSLRHMAPQSFPLTDLSDPNPAKDFGSTTTLDEFRFSLRRLLLLIDLRGDGDLEDPKGFQRL